MGSRKKKTPKVRRVWDFKPVSRVVEGKTRYRRKKSKEQLRRELKRESD